MIKKLLPLLLAGMIVINFTACETAADETKEPSSAVAAMSDAVYTTISDIVTNEITAVSTKSSSIKLDKGYNVTVENVSSGSITQYNIHITWSGYSYNGVALSSGTIDITYIMNTVTGNISYDYSGDFVVVYDSVTYNFGYDISLSVVDGSYQYSGTYSVDGDKYSFSYSAK